MNRYEKYIGKKLHDRYYIKTLIGLGGTSVVFEGVDTECEDRPVAIKMLREELWTEETYKERLFLEADTLSNLNHPCISKLYGRYSGQDMQYLVMEYVDGITLRQYLIKKGYLETPVIISIVSQILQVLSYLHKNGIVHGDIKPQNILMQASGRIVLTDFGVARQGVDNEVVNMEGEAVGTVYYLSPEQVRGMESCFRSDLYSLGVMMYEMTCGELPFSGDDAEQIAHCHLEQQPESLRAKLPTVPKGLEQIIFGAMEKQLPLRYQTADQMLADILNLKKDPFAIFSLHPGLRYSEDADTLIGYTEEEKNAKVPFTDLKAPLLRKNSKSFLPYMVGICFAFLVVCLVLIFYGYDRIFKDSKLNVFAVESIETVTIDNYLGKSVTETFKEELSELGYNVKITEEFSSEHEKGVIISQKPEPYAVRKLGGFTLELVMSKGKDIKTMSDYSMLHYRDVKYALIDEGYEVIVEWIDREGFDFGTVVNTSPAPGASVEANTVITVYVSRGPDISYITMPTLLGRDEKKAMDLIVEYGLRVGTVTYVKTDAYSAGTIVSQSILSGAIVPKLSKINLVIAK